jgi:hypothetical protein
MSHLIEIYSDGVIKDVADYLILIDFGGDEKYAADAINYVYTKLKAQSDKRGLAKFDLTVISHQDKDHLVLLGPLGVKITEGIANGDIKQIQFGGVFLGGVAWDQKNKNTVDTFFGISKTRPQYNWSENQRSDYLNVNSRSNLGKLDEFPGVAGFAFRVLISQLAVPGLTKSQEDIKRNASSTVIVIENGKDAVILPGDATYHTMKYITDLYTSWGINLLIPAVRALEVPHHGAIRTAVENYLASSKADEVNMDIVKKFAKDLAPLEAFASAGNLPNHGHPVYEVLEIFKNKVGFKVENHTYVAYAFDEKGDKKKEHYHEYATTDAIRTTLVSFLNGLVWKNITIELPKVGTDSAVEAKYTLAELLIRDGLTPPPEMLRSRTSGTPPAPPPPFVVYAPAPTPEEAASKPDEAKPE